jgi:tetratricopeptide (TPR) repeat protein
MRIDAVFAALLALSSAAGAADKPPGAASEAIAAALAQAEALAEQGDATAAFEILKPLKADDEQQMIALFVERGIAANDIGDFAVARKDLWRAFALLDRQQAPDPERMARTLNGIGYMYHHSGVVPAAHAQYQAALPWYEKAYGKPSAAYAGLLSNIGEAFRDDGRTDLSLRYATEALAMLDSLEASEVPVETRSRLLNNLGTAQFQHGDKAAALDSFRRSLKIQEKASGKNDPRLASTISNIGIVHHELGEHAKALPFLKRALALKEQQFGPQSPQLEPLLFDLKVVHQALGNATEAASIQMRLARIAAQDSQAD